MNISTQILFGFISLVYPTYLFITYRRDNGQLKTDKGFRLIYYQRLTFIFWILNALVLGNTYLDTSLTLDFYPTLNKAGKVSAFLILIFIILQVATSRVSTTEKATSVQHKTGDGYHFLPKSKREFVWFNILSVSAGICEEIIFRLFIFSYLLFHTNLTTAFLLTNVIFALTHIDMDKRNMISSFLMGMLFSAVYYLSNNIWLAIILHIAIDINIGYLGYQAKNLTKTTIEK